MPDDASAATTIIDEGGIADTLARRRRPDPARVRDVLARARALGGLDPDDVAVLMDLSEPDDVAALLETARAVKNAVYGNRLVLFAPLYVSNLCGNECLYCAFRVRNRAVRRRALTRDEIAGEVRHLVERGHKRILLVAGEAYPHAGFRYILDAIDTIYSVASGRGSIRRVNVNVAPLTADEFRQLKAARIGTYQLFQETYHRGTYHRVHVAGHKTDYGWRLAAVDRAMQAGIDDVGVGVLFGLADWRFEVLALMQHVRYLEGRFGVGPHTISVPRLEPAAGSDMAAHPPSPVSDGDFRKLIAILRLAVPYTGIILSTRETAAMRHEAFSLGVSQISAGSRTNPGGYSAPDEHPDESQFSLGDHRSLDEVVRDVASLGYVPSFCTACYRLGRTGRDFMDLARPGDIRSHCGPNAVATFAEYLEDYASPETRSAGLEAIAGTLAEMDPEIRRRAERMIAAVRGGRRDVYC